MPRKTKWADLPLAHTKSAPAWALLTKSKTPTKVLGNTLSQEPAGDMGNRKGLCRWHFQNVYGMLIPGPGLVTLKSIWSREKGKTRGRTGRT